MSEELQDIFSELAIKGWGEDVDKIIQEIERLQDRIDKAIEYIESYLPNYSFDKSNLKKLLEILRGEE